MACGSNGSACATCDPAFADGCANGGCTCGGTAACLPGQKCIGGVCVCNAATCPSGCCNSGSCIAPPTLARCGLNGATCVTCDLDLADICSATGVCGCGIGPACAAGSRCLGGLCQCDGVSCANGCCEGSVCHAPPSVTFCGLNGAACQNCTSNKTCNNSVCLNTGVGGGGGGGIGGGGGSGGGSGWT